MSAGIAGCIIALNNRFFPPLADRLCGFSARLKSIVFDSFVFVNITNTGSLASADPLAVGWQNAGRVRGGGERQAVPGRHA
jgi:hypothetical protein